MRRSTPFVALLLCALTALPAQAAGTITGKLNKHGYTVVALAEDGTAVSVNAKTGAFKVRAPASTVTLQLRGPNGRYAGPIVVGKTKHGKVILGIRRGAKLGRLAVKNGYAAPVHKLNRRFTNPRVSATAKGGGPIGSRTFGLVPGKDKLRQTGPVTPTQPGSEGVPGPTSAGGDSDSDGVPNAFDIDSNGNGVLDSVDAEAPPAPGFGVFSQMFLTIDQTVNADASAISTADIDAAMKAHLSLVFTAVPENVGVELDCGGLSYCSAGGTGQHQTGPAGAGGTLDPFPACCDSNANGWGSLNSDNRGPTGSEFVLKPNASSTEIGSGDTMIEHITSNTAATELPGSLNFVFDTVPALKAWSSGTATTPTPVTYPVAAGGPGTQANPLPVTKAANGDYTLTLTFWRPQRKAIAGAGEGSDFVDIGGLAYDVNIPNAGGPAGGSGAPVSPQCDPASLSTADPHGAVVSDGNGSIGRVADNAPDQPSDPANTLTFSVDLTKCLADKGTTIGAGQTFNMDVGANSLSAHSVDHANQIVYVKTQ
jgi:hypothetical protein